MGKQSTTEVEMQEGLPEGDANASGEQMSANHAPVGLTQPQLNDLIGKNHRDGYEKGRSEATAETESRLRAEMEAKIKQELDPEKIRSLMQEEAKRQMDEHERLKNNAHAEKVVNEFMQKMSDGESPDSTLDETVKNLNLSGMPQIVQLVNEVPHTKHAMYELAKNPHKIAQLMMLAHTDPQLARIEAKKLSDSIEKNLTAQSPDVSEPSAQLRHSHTGSDSGKQSVRDLRKQPWLGNLA